ncbi:MAG: J domain-containing protein [Anaerolineae bacterium]|nr:J domain-containing protein [Anaerolineae bacterium]
MGLIRIETYHAGGYLIAGLWQSGQIRQMLNDGADIILFEKNTGEKVSIHLIDSGIELYEIRKTLSENADKGIYTMFMLWGVMMIPPQGKVFQMTAWMEGFLALNNGCVYAYDILDGEIFIYPVFLQGEGDLRVTTYGLTVTFNKLTCRAVETTLAGFSDTWLVADFIGVGEAAEVHEAPPPLVEPLPINELAALYRFLGIEPDADRETIKTAYRTLARQMHPDSNPAPDANQQMQQLNEAYEKLLAALPAEEL